MKRLPIIRHVRYLFKVIWYEIWWIRVGRHLGAFPNPGDLEYLEDVWRGRA